MKFLDNSARNFGIVIGLTAWCLLDELPGFIRNAVYLLLTDQHPFKERVFWATLVAIVPLMAAGVFALRKSRAAFLFAALCGVCLPFYWQYIGFLQGELMRWKQNASYMGSDFSGFPIGAQLLVGCIVPCVLFLPCYVRATNAVSASTGWVVERNVGIMLGCAGGCLWSTAMNTGGWLLPVFLGGVIAVVLKFGRKVERIAFLLMSVLMFVQSVGLALAFRRRMEDYASWHGFDNLEWHEWGTESLTLLTVVGWIFLLFFFSLSLAPNQGGGV